MIIKPMELTLPGMAQIQLRQLAPADLPALEQYLGRLSADSRRRFAPHPYDAGGILQLYSQGRCKGYIAEEKQSGRMLAYAVIRDGYPENERERLVGFGIDPRHHTDCSFAPSVADDWQGKGLGVALFRYILQQLAGSGKTRVFLWGGVQADNQKAVNYYHKLGFRTIGHFEYHGWNMDMVYEIRT